MLRSFRHRDFRLLWLGMLAVNALLPLQFITLSLYLLDRGGSSSGVLLVGVLAAVRGTGMLLCALFGGVIADRIDRRRLLLTAQSVALAANSVVALALLHSPGGPRVTNALIFAAAFVAAGALAVDTPTRQAMIPQLVGEDDLANAIALDVVAIQLAFPLSLPVAGTLIDTLGFGRAYALGLLGHVAVLTALILLQYRGRAIGGSRSMLRDLRVGVRYARDHQTIGWIILLVFSLSMIGMPGVAQLGPVWMRTVLGLTPTEFGFMASTWGLGAMLGSVILAQTGHFARKGTLLAVSAVLFAAFVLVFGYSRNVPLTALANFGLGMTLSFTNVSAVALTQRLVPNAIQGRVMSLFMMNQGLSQIGAGPIGALGQAVTLPLLVPLLGWLSLACVLAITLGRPQIRHAGYLEQEPADLTLEMDAPAAMPPQHASG
jgi:predicted MFS family arabinose efflux permease